MRERQRACVGPVVEREQSACVGPVVEREHILDREHILSIEEMSHHIVGTEAETEQASRKVRHDAGHGGQVGHGGLCHGGHGGNGGMGALEQRKNDGMDSRRRQSKRKEVVGGGLGMDSKADKEQGGNRIILRVLSG